jgi:hypothetical protein
MEVIQMWLKEAVDFTSERRACFGMKRSIQMNCSSYSDTSFGPNWAFCVWLRLVRCAQEGSLHRVSWLNQLKALVCSWIVPPIGTVLKARTGPFVFNLNKLQWFREKMIRSQCSWIVPPIMLLTLAQTGAFMFNLRCLNAFKEVIPDTQATQIKKRRGQSRWIVPPIGTGA